MGRSGYPIRVIDLRSLSRPLLAAGFIAGGISVLRDPRRHVRAAEEVGVPIAERVGLPTDPTELVRINAAVQVGAGALLAVGVLPRVASVALSASLIPTTIAGHPFWKERDPDRKAAQRIQFLKNAGLLGGLLATALDTGGRPSVFWAGRRAASHAAARIGSTATAVGEAVSNVVP